MFPENVWQNEAGRLCLHNWSLRKKHQTENKLVITILLSVADEVLDLTEKLTHTVCSCGRDLLVSSCPHPETYRTSLSLNMMLHSVRPETTVTDTINVSTECLLLFYISWTSGLFSHSFNTIRLQPEASPPAAIVWLNWVCIIVWYEVERFTSQ